MEMTLYDQQLVVWHLVAQLYRLDAKYDQEARALRALHYITTYCN